MNKLINEKLKKFAEIADDWFKENSWLESRYKFFQNFFKDEVISNAGWEDFQTMGDQLHCFNSMRIAKANALGKQNLAIERYREIFMYILSEKDAINITINNLYKKYDGNYHLPYFGDSSISEIVAWIFPSKYTMYNARDIEALKILGLKLKSKRGERFGDKFLRYNEMVNQLLPAYKEIVGLRTQTTANLEIDQFFSWLYTSYSKTNYWIFQGNPNAYDFETGLREGIISDWTVSAHKDKIQAGDKAIIWITGKSSGCYALAEVLSEPYEESASTDDHLWKEENKFELKVDINITHNLIDAPILKENVMEIETLKNIKIGNRGTNFTATEKEYLTLLKMIKSADHKRYWLYAPGNNASLWDEFYEKGIMGLGWDDIGNLSHYSSRSEIEKALIANYGGKGSKKNDILANDNFLNKMNIGDVVIVKKGRRELLGYGIIISDYKYDNTRKEYQSIREVDWRLKGSWSVDFPLVVKTLTDITEYETEDPNYETYYQKLLGTMGVDNTTNDKRDKFVKWLSKKYGKKSGTINSYPRAIDLLSKTLKKDIFQITDDDFLYALYQDLIKEQNNLDSKYYHQDAPSYGTNGFYSAAVKSYRQFIESHSQILQQEEPQMNFPLNTILYGPPGTGKTYNTIKRAAEIIEDRVIDNYGEALDIFKANLHDQIEFITFHQNYSYEDFIQGLRPDTDDDVKELTFEKKDGIFKIIADKALENSIDSKNPSVAKRTFEEVFNEFINPLVEGDVEEIEVQMKKVSYYITSVTNKSIEFRKNSGGTAHTLSILTLKKFYDAESLLNIRGLSSYYAPLLDELLKIGKDPSGKKKVVQKKNYVIIIDEINRANISRVFGELITLIEPDKRSGGKIPMEAILPSGDPFTVPSNLYIIGTMNTADKSIALLDIALRRRFEFEAMYPKYEIDGEEIYDVDILRKINEQVIKSKGHDFQIGHSYFMGDNKDLVKRMNNKVIPLLLEYYMNDEKEVKEILKNAGLAIEKHSWPIRISGKND